MAVFTFLKLIVGAHNSRLFKLSQSPINFHTELILYYSNFYYEPWNLFDLRMGTKPN
jgi:hypothetical protein